MIDREALGLILKLVFAVALLGLGVFILVYLALALYHLVPLLAHTPPPQKTNTCT